MNHENCKVITTVMGTDLILNNLHVERFQKFFLETKDMIIVHVLSYLEILQNLKMKSQKLQNKNSYLQKRIHDS